MSNKKGFDLTPLEELWEPIGFKYPEQKERETVQSKTHSFLGYLEDMDKEPYEVPGLLPKAPQSVRKKCY